MELNRQITWNQLLQIYFLLTATLATSLYFFLSNLQTHIIYKLFCITWKGPDVTPTKLHKTVNSSFSSVCNHQLLRAWFWSDRNLIHSLKESNIYISHFPRTDWEDVTNHIRRSDRKKMQGPASSILRHNKKRNNVSESK